MNTQVMSGSDKLHEDYQARKRHREWWVDLNRDIGGGFPEEVTLEYGPSGSQGESYVYVLGEEGSKLREQDEGLRQGGAPGICLGWGWGMRSSLEAGGRLRASVLYSLGSPAPGQEGTHSRHSTNETFKGTSSHPKQNRVCLLGDSRRDKVT